jgi:hypothetical protein
VGPTLRTSLLKTLGSARRVRESSVAELAAVPKVTPKLAQRIYEHFHPLVPENPGVPEAPDPRVPEAPEPGVPEEPEPAAQGFDSERWLAQEEVNDK